MRFAFTDEQEELRHTLRRLLQERAPSEEVRRAAATAEGHDRKLWSLLSEIGLPALPVPEEYGGAGFGFVDLAVALEETGRGPLPSPLLPSAVLASGAVLSGADRDAREELLPGIATGDTLAALTGVNLAHGEPGSALNARRTSGGWAIDGIDPMTLGGEAADVLVITAHTPQGLTLFVTPGDTTGLTLSPLTTMDETRRFARAEFRNVMATCIGTPGSAAGAVRHAVRLAQVSIALESVGGAQRCLDMAVEYARTRVQFGQPVGSFQAVQHLLADSLLRVESARSAAWYAAWCVDNAPERLPLYASLAKSYCTEAYLTAAGTCLQVHGGIGFTWEHDAHLHLKRAKSSQSLLGSPAGHRVEVAERIGLTPSAEDGGFTESGTQGG
ncbi:acyl-CoA dehydrogenase family protein [Streptomyces malaysiensis]|uniref:Acyl-CoA dehydrogenase n=1 Tax=Streptomyces malaysiensis TaxID=92644 RepID=A0A7X6AVC9_STRMQ|nr:acyl-CoA dehydrogenase family protein [Streptomyces malaysiensis]NIY64209.1 hypothetical protein [Streptomyces malaysiensis]